MASVSRKDGYVIFDLPDLNDDTDREDIPTFNLYAIVEAANTAHIPTLSTNEKRADKILLNNIRRVSPSVFDGYVFPFW